MALPSANISDLAQLSYKETGTGIVGSLVCPAPGQHFTPITNVSGANASMQLNTGGFGGMRWVLRRLFGFLSAAGTATVSIQHASGIVWTLPNLTSTAQISLIPSPDLPEVGLVTPSGFALIINVGAAGVGVTSTIIMLADLI